MTHNIVVTQNLLLTNAQKQKLETFGDVIFYETAPETPKERLDRVEGATIILSEEPGLHENVYNLKNVFLTFPFTGFLEEVDIKTLKDNNVITASAKGGNKFAVTERIIYALLELTRQFSAIYEHKILISPTSLDTLPVQGLYSKHALILGKGNIGQQTGKVLEAMGMNVTFFTREESLYAAKQNITLIINCLGDNESTAGIVNDLFIQSFEKSFFYITVARKHIHDTKALIDAVTAGKIIGYADDCASGNTGDTGSEYYQFLKKSLNTYNAFVTPHIARAADSGIINSNDIVVANVEAYCLGKPKNLLY